MDCAKLFVDDLNHSLNFLGGDWPCPGLLSQEVHDVGGELVASLLVLLHLLLVDGPDLSQLVLVVGVLDRRPVVGQGRGGRGAALVGTCVYPSKNRNGKIKSVTEPLSKCRLPMMPSATSMLSSLISCGSGGLSSCTFLRLSTVRSLISHSTENRADFIR